MMQMKTRFFALLRRVAPWVLAAALGGALAPALSACSCQAPSGSAGAQSAAAARDSESKPAPNPRWTTYNVATTADYPPFTFLDSKAQVIGFDADVLAAIAKNQRFNLAWQPTVWKGVFETIESGQADILAMAFVISPRTDDRMDFSDPYLRSGRGALTWADGAKSIASLADKRIVTQEGTTNIPILQERFGVDANIIPVRTNYLELFYLINKQADAAYDDAHVLQYHLRNTASGSFALIPDPSYKPDSFAFVVKKGNADLKKKLDDGLSAIVANGEYNRIYEKWFGTNVDELGFTVE